MQKISVTNLHHAFLDHINSVVTRKRISPTEKSRLYNTIQFGYTFYFVFKLIISQNLSHLSVGLSML